MGQENGVGLLENPNTDAMSPAYVEAMNRGYKAVIYVCDEGRERSLSALRAAKDRGEIHSELLEDGMWGFVKKYKDEEKILEKVREKFQNKKLRIFQDGQSYPTQFIAALKEANIDFEVVTTGSMMKELLRLGQDPAEFFS